MYNVSETLPTNKRVQLINRKEFALAVLDPSKDVSVVYIASLNLSLKMSIHPIREAQIALLLTKEVVIPVEYLDYTNIFSKRSVAKLFKRSNINQDAINLESSK